MHTHTTIDSQEVAKFSRLATQWWDPNGPLKTLHDINSTRMEFIKQYINIKSSRILDVGCGGGILCESLAKHDAKVTGLDVDLETITCAQTHALRRNLIIDYVCQPIEMFSSPSFDSITCMEMLEHVREPQVVINNCARLLNHNGYLFLSTINRTIQAYATAIVAAEYLLKLLPRQTHDFDKFIKPSELVYMVRSVGLKLVGMKGINYNPFTRKACLQDSVAVNYLLVCQKV